MERFLMFQITRIPKPIRIFLAEVAVKIFD